ncbi:MAG: amidohydrolase [Chloroflexi bacterium]|nr:amidohydrolase [Chloroflexota bacterium]
MPNTPVIDADGHVLEFTIDWEGGLEEHLLPVAPRIVGVETGGSRFLVEGKIWPQPWGKGRGAGSDIGSTSVRPGGTDPAERIKDMDQEGIDVAFNYGAVVGVGVSGLENAELAAALARIYNDWLADYCSHAPDRLKGIAAIPLQDVSRAVAEARRAVEELGMAGVSIPSNVHGTALHDPSFYPFYEEIQRLDVPLGIHVGPGIPGIPMAGADRYDNFFMIHIFSHPFEQMLSVISLICGGVLERFPKLRVAFLESGAGWSPFLLDRMDEDYEKLSHMAPELRAKPSEYLRSGRCFISCEPDETTLPTVVSLLGEDHLIYASDYPHWDSRSPDSVNLLNQRADISPRAKAKILGGNASRLYKLG